VDAAEVFWALHGDLPREGVGSDATTRTLLELTAPLPASPCALDVGCGPGRASLVLAGAGVRVTAVDLHEPFLRRTRSAAQDAGLAGRVAVERASMTALPHPDGTFDLLWSEGAAYLMGVDRALVGRPGRRAGRSWGRTCRPTRTGPTTTARWPRRSTQ